MSSAGALATAVPQHEADPLVVSGRTLRLRYPTPEDAPGLFELARDPAVTRFFSWGPYTSVEQPEAYIASLAAKRARGELMDFLIEHRSGAPVGITGLSEVSVRDRRATIGSWLGHRWWGSGANAESKGLITALAFRRLGMERLTAWASTENGRSQVALARLGFRREGVLAAWHRHGGRPRDVVVFGMLRAGWERSPLAAFEADIDGTPPPAFVTA